MFFLLSFLSAFQLTSHCRPVATTHTSLTIFGESLLWASRFFYVGAHSKRVR